jgi:hypothetical protein
MTVTVNREAKNALGDGQFVMVFTLSFRGRSLAVPAARNVM